MPASAVRPVARVAAEGKKGSEVPPSKAKGADSTPPAGNAVEAENGARLVWEESQAAAKAKKESEQSPSKGKKQAPALPPADEVSGEEIPLPFLIAAAALALIAFGVQIWTFLS